MTQAQGTGRALYLHIGMAKTGSTSIQATFAANRARLGEHGIGYLSLGSSHDRILMALFGDEPLDRKPRRKTARHVGGSGEVDRPNLARHLEEELAANTMPTFVMSGERLLKLEPPSVMALKSYLSGFFDQFRIVVYVREPASWASSMAQNAIKNGKATLEDLCRARPKAPGGVVRKIVPQYSLIQSYIAAFGRDRVDIRLFDRRRFVGGDLIQDFCAAIGHPALNDGLQELKKNVSLSQEAVLLLSEQYDRSRAQGCAVSRKDIVALRKTVGQPAGSPFALPSETLDRVRLAAAEDLRWLREIMGEEVFADGPDRP